MKAFAHVQFTGFYPAGTAAVVVADNADEAAQLLSESLKSIHLGQDIKADEFVEIDLTQHNAMILRDGDY
jgi:hypothetical protein